MEHFLIWTWMGFPFIFYSHLMNNEPKLKYRHEMGQRRKGENDRLPKPVLKKREEIKMVILSLKC